MEISVIRMSFLFYLNVQHDFQIFILFQIYSAAISLKRGADAPCGAVAIVVVSPQPR